MHSFFVQLAQVIGPLPAMVFCAFASESKSFYIPKSYRAGHILERLVGEDAFLAMIANYGGETILPPSMRLDDIRNIGRVYRLSRRRLSPRQIEEQTGLGYRNIKYIQARIDGGEALSPLGISTSPKTVSTKAFGNPSH